MANIGKKPTPKTQRQISISQQQPYVPPAGAPGFSSTGNPNNNSYPPNKNRGNQISFRGDDTKPFSLGLKDVDEAVMYYITEIIKPTVMQNGAQLNVPVYYGSPERWVQVQKKGYLQDKKGKIMMPLITFKRTSIEKVRNLSNKLDANFPNNVQLFEKKYSKRNEYDNFNILNNRAPKKDYYAVVIPDYMTLNYDFIISTYYVEQMNGIVEAMNYASDSYWGDPERFKFRANINSITNVVELPAGGERVVKSTFSMKLHGYVVPNITQKQLASVKKISNASQVIVEEKTTDDIEAMFGYINLDNDREEINPKLHDKE
jgi:hypothetical protein